MTYEKFEYGPLITYEIVWTSGCVERIKAHQVLTPPDDSFTNMFGGLGVGTRTTQPRGWLFHGEVEGRWQLLLSAPAEDIKTVRNVTHTSDWSADAE